jgi:hypothetical protein
MIVRQCGVTSQVFSYSMTNLTEKVIDCGKKAAEPIIYKSIRLPLVAK